MASTEGKVDAATNDDNTTGEEANPPVKPRRASLAKDTEKGDGELGSSNSSEAGSPTDQDVEKAAPVIATETEELPDPSDPNVVDWEGPDDPQNPQNW